MTLKSSRHGSQAWRRRHDALYGMLPAGYRGKVLGYDPIAYWMLAEASGTVATCEVNPAQNGTYTSDVSTWPPGDGIGDGNTAPGFDGTNDAISLGAGALAALNTVFNGNLGSVAGWLRVSGVGVWTDGTTRYGLNVFGDANNFVRLIRHSTNNRFAFYREAGNGNEYRFENGLSYTTWMRCVITWDHAADEVMYYLNGVWLETDGGLIAWNAAAVANVIIGAGGVGPVAFPWSGWAAHFVLWNRVLNATEILDLATV